MHLKPSLILIGYLAACIGLIASESPLTEAQADAIVQAEAQEKAARNLARKTDFIILDQKVIEQDGKRRLIINRVKPPAPSAPNPKPTPKPIIQGDELLPTKAHAMLRVSATVFGGQVTQINWTHEEQTYTAYSNVDFNLMRGASTISTPEVDYTLMMGIGNETDMGSLPDLPDFTPGEVEYFVISDEDELLDPNAYGGIDMLHQYFAENETELRAQAQRVDALNAARKKYREENPEPKETVINIWRKK